MALIGLTKEAIEILIDERTQEIINHKIQDIAKDKNALWKIEKEIKERQDNIEFRFKKYLEQFADDVKESKKFTGIFLDVMKENREIKRELKEFRNMKKKINVINKLHKQKSDVQELTEKENYLYQAFNQLGEIKTEEKLIEATGYKSSTLRVMMSHIRSKGHPMKFNKRLANV